MWFERAVRRLVCSVKMGIWAWGPSWPPEAGDKMSYVFSQVEGFDGVCGRVCAGGWATSFRQCAGESRAHATVAARQKWRSDGPCGTRTACPRALPQRTKPPKGPHNPCFRPSDPYFSRRGLVLQLCARCMVLVACFANHATKSDDPPKSAVFSICGSF